MVKGRRIDRIPAKEPVITPRTIFDIGSFVKKKFTELPEYFQEISALFSDFSGKVLKFFLTRRNVCVPAMATKSNRRPGKTNIQDVAKLAGVSLATVSRVATGSDRVSPELRARVLKAA